MKHDGIPAFPQGSIPCALDGRPGTLSSDAKGLRVEHRGRAFPCRQPAGSWADWYFDASRVEAPAVLRPASAVPRERRLAP